MTTQQPKVNRGIVKQVLSGDTIIIRGQPKGGPPKEKTIILSNIIAPKLGRRATANSEETKDEPYAWDAREFLRKKLIGEEVLFTLDKTQNTSREYGCIYLGKDLSTAENVTESLVAEGLASVRREGGRSASPEHAKLLELEKHAEVAGKGKWAQTGSQEHIRDIKWAIENPRNFVDKFQQKPIKAIIEHVRDGSTVRAFLLPDFYHITLMISGIRCPGFKLDADGKPDPTAVVPYADEAKFVVESMLLQRDVEIVLESVNNNNFVGSILHPKGNIAEVLLKQGFARCVDWSMAFMTTGAEKLRAAEKVAKEKKLRLWKDYQATGPQVSGKEKEFSGIVVEVMNGDALNVRLPDGKVKKVFLASIRPPRQADGKTDDAPQQRNKVFRPLYDIPWMFEAREFLRKKLIGKRVNVVVDYIQTARDNFPEKICCTVTIGGVNVAEAMVSKGLATVVRYRQDDDQRSSHYDELLAAEMKAAKSGNGLHSKKNIPNHRVADVSGDLNKAKQFLPFLQRAQRTEAIVEFVASGSRLRLYIPKETCLVTFLLGGINCPRGSRPGPGNTGTVEGEPYGEEALAFTKDKCLQREVEIHVESMDKAGNFIGWLWIEGVNLSVALVETGLASVHPTAERSEHYRALKTAEDTAKAKKLKIWKDYVEENEEEKKIEEERVVERKIDYQKVLIIEATPDLHFYAQMVDQVPNLEQLMAKIRQEFTTNPPLPGAHTPKKGELCAARFSLDREWYRAKVEKISGSNVSVFYVDYGNRETINVSDCAKLPAEYSSEKYFAQEYALACVQLPRNDNDYREEAVKAFISDVENRPVLLNIEYRIGNLPHVTLVEVNDHEEDIVKNLIKDGLLLVDIRREKRLQKLVEEYKAAEEVAKKNHLNVWEYGDIRDDDAKEFGLGR
ncbi:staphylococcal nuclease domain-containing protein 1 [Schistocerca gregaria]|uniref:Staphylococcal nuclease domain-containing protein 1 n=1 Tax=Schistocerca gregaria TaxID=7010 RepID=A0A8E5JTN2_SCHGR|nr:staphylococcal nuclease domain-containing protein 1 [Schistocerca gregaria]QVD39548.1 Tudor-SN [Schistocerca gregaria]